MCPAHRKFAVHKRPAATQKAHYGCLLPAFIAVKRGGLKACGDEGALRFQLTKAKAVCGMQLCGMQEMAFDNDRLDSLENYLPSV